MKLLFISHQIAPFVQVEETVKGHVKATVSMKMIENLNAEINRDFSQVAAD